MKKLLISGITIVPLAIYIYLVAGADRGTLPPFIDSLYDFPHGDKYGHIGIMGVLSFALLTTVRLLAPCSKRRKASIAAVVFLFILFTLEEFSQQLFPNRTFSWMDLLSSYLGTVIGIMIAILFTIKRKKEAVA